MIKILYVASTLGRTGPTNWLYNLIKYLDKSVFEISLLTLSSEPDDSRWNDFEKLGIHMRSLNLSRIAGMFSASKRIKKIVYDIKPDIIHSHGLRSDIHISSLRKKKVCTVHNIPQDDYCMAYGKLKGRLMVYVHMLSLNRFDMCIAVSKTAGTNLKENHGLKNVVVIPNGIETKSFFPADSNEKERLRQHLNLPLKKGIWISSGSLSERKNPLFLIKFWKKNMDSDSILLFIGDGNLRKLCDKEAENSTNIIIRGKVINVSDYLRASDYYISASKSEGLPLAVIEAMACGLPPVLSDIQPHKDVLAPLPEAGCVYEQGNEESLFHNLLFMKNETEKMQGNAVKLVKENFSAEACAFAYGRVYQELLT